MELLDKLKAASKAPEQAAQKVSCTGSPGLCPWRLVLPCRRPGGVCRYLHVRMRCDTMGWTHGTALPVPWALYGRLTDPRG